MQNKLSERLKKLRADTELSQAKLATILNIKQQTYDGWEQGRNQPDVEMLIRLAMYFDVTVDYLIGLSNDIAKLGTVKNTSIINNGHNNGIMSGSINIDKRKK